MMPLAGFKLTRSLSTPDPATRPQAAAPVGMEPQPAVVKKMAEIPPETEAQQFYDEAQALRRLGRVDAAAGKYRLALDRHPGLRNARIQLASLMQETGQGDAALALLKTGYAYQPDSAMAIATGRLLADQGQRAEALDWLQRGQDSLRPSDLALMGALLSKAARYEEAVNAYQQALRAEPHQGGWLLGLGLALESLGLRQEAQTAFRNALERGAFKPEVVTFLRLKINAAGP